MKNNFSYNIKLFNTKAYYEDFGIQHFMQTGSALKTAYYYAPSLTIDGLTCGYQGPGDKTIIPAEAKAKIDFRLVPNQEPDNLLEKFKSHLHKHHFDNVLIISHHGYPPARVPLTFPYLRVIEETCEQIYGHLLVVHPHKCRSVPMYLFKMDCFSLGCGNAFEQVRAPN